MEQAPLEVIIKILKPLTGQEYRALSCVNRRFNQICRMKEFNDSRCFVSSRIRQRIVYELDPVISFPEYSLWSEILAFQMVVEIIEEVKRRYYRYPSNFEWSLRRLLLRTTNKDRQKFLTDFLS